MASDAWLEIARDLGRFQGDGAGFRGWTATIARAGRWTICAARRDGPDQRRSNRALRTCPVCTARPTRLWESLATEYALQLVRGLPQDQAEAVLLRVVVGLDGPAAARVLGKRPRTARTAAHRGLKRLARQLGVGDVMQEVPWTLREST